MLILFADSVTYLYVSRLMCGFATGFVYFSVVPTYLGEISSDKIRGKMLSISPILSKSGFLFTYSIAPFVSIYTMAGILLIPPLIMYATFAWCPETPYYLLGKGKHAEALKNLARLRGHTDVDEELQRMNKAVELSNENKGSYKELLSPDNRKGLIIIILLAFGSQACGSETFMVYSELIFRQIGNDFIASAYINIVFGAVFLISAIISNLLIDKVGRRKLLLYSVCLIACCTTIMTVFFNYQKNGHDVQFITWLPTLAFLFSIFGVGCGISTLVLAFIGEIFSKHMKAVAGIIFTILLSCSSFAFSKMFQYVTDNFGYDAMFGIFAGCSSLYIPIFWLIIPETKGKPLDVILEELKIVKSESKNKVIK